MCSACVLAKILYSLNTVLSLTSDEQHSTYVSTFGRWILGRFSLLSSNTGHMSIYCIRSCFVVAEGQPSPSLSWILGNSTLDIEICLCIYLLANVGTASGHHLHADIYLLLLLLLLL